MTPDFSELIERLRYSSHLSRLLGQSGEIYELIDEAATALQSLSSALEAERRDTERLVARVATLEGSIEALVGVTADAERYRFIRYHSPSYFRNHWLAESGGHDDIDSAIDRAIKDTREDIP